MSYIKVQRLAYKFAQTLASKAPATLSWDKSQITELQTLINKSNNTTRNYVNSHKDEFKNPVPIVDLAVDGVYGPKTQESVNTILHAFGLNDVSQLVAELRKKFP